MKLKSSVNHHCKFEVLRLDAASFSQSNNIHKINYVQKRNVTTVVDYDKEKCKIVFEYYFLVQRTGICTST
jgi:hypothetical protein